MALPSKAPLARTMQLRNYKNPIITFGNAFFRQAWQISSGYRLICATKNDIAGSKLGFLTNGGALGLGFFGASTHCLAISRAFSTNHILNTRGKLHSMSDRL